MNYSNILLFPSSHSDAYDYYKEGMVAASSGECDSFYKEWHYLPDIYQPDFAEALAQLIREHDIKAAYCPSTQAYPVLQKMGIDLINESPGTLTYYKNLLKRAESARVFIDNIHPTDLTIEQVATLLKQASSIYGESHYDKILAMIAIFADAPEGISVELGALLGKTANIMGIMARHHDVGDVLVIDPWDLGASVQEGVVNNWDWELAHKAFRINMFGRDNVRYVRDSSQYVVVPLDISVLHIDANHGYECVKSDYKRFGKNVLPGGWIILDDYNWLHGDGPRRVGDEILATGKIQRHFVCGGALFLKVAR